MGDLIDAKDEGDMKLDIGVPVVVWETKLRKLAGVLTSSCGEELRFHTGQKPPKPLPHIICKMEFHNLLECHSNVLLHF